MMLNIFNYKIECIISQFRCRQQVQAIQEDIVTNRFDFPENVTNFAEYLLIYHKFHMKKVAAYNALQVVMTFWFLLLCGL